MAAAINPAAPQRWSTAQVQALAPDAASQKAGARLAAPAPWSGCGARAESGLVWGDCKGSGAKPYQVTVQLPADAIFGAGYVAGIPRLGIPSLRETDASLGIANAGRRRSHPGGAGPFA